MEIMNSLATFFGLDMEIVTFTDLIQWLVYVLMAVTIVVVSIKALFTATWKVERSLR